jgi:signal transduction histidine kinase
MEAFAGRVAHDVQGPLAPVSLAIHLVQRSLDRDDARQNTLERGRRSLAHVQSVIADLLAFACAGGSSKPGASASLREAVANVVHDLEGQALEAGVRILVDDLPLTSLTCAPGVLASILFNLVGNALKYMPPDSVERAVRVTGTRKNRSLVRIEVTDTGGGLPSGDPRRLFAPYVRGSGAARGLGLGLATVRRLVEAHGGHVGACPNEATRGATFWFEMPEAGSSGAL